MSALLHPHPSRPNRQSVPFCPVEIIKPFLTPYYITIAAVLGAADSRVSGR